MSEIPKAFQEFKKEHDFLVAIDSDGCAFDTMEIKHKECFIPNIINEWGLQAISKYVREAAEFVNLYSRWRGINRFPALIDAIDLAAEREEVKKRGFKIPETDSLRKWIGTETKLGNPALEEIVKKTGDPVLERALKWSKAVNKSVADIVRDVPPFPFVRESLAKLAGIADIIVVSATPGEALVREWNEHDIARYIKVIAGQEMGGKKDCIAYTMAKGYSGAKVIMIGDAPGDMKAAKANDALFYPINPGNEDESWQRFFNEAMDKFLNGQYAGAYEEKLIEEFDGYLPSVPPWKLKKVSG